MGNPLLAPCEGSAAGNHSGAARPRRVGDVPLCDLLGVREPDLRHSLNGRHHGGENDDCGGPRHRRQPDAVEAAGGRRDGDGISPALLEELQFDESGIASRDWRTYPILKMADIPEIKVVLLNRPEVGTYGGGSEAANALAAPAIAAALFDATGKVARRLPLKSEYVQALLKA
jgi:hypothetical protein